MFHWSLEGGRPGVGGYFRPICHKEGAFIYLGSERLSSVLCANATLGCWGGQVECVTSS